MTESTIVAADETPPDNTFVMTRELDLQLRRFINYLRNPGVRMRLIDSFVREIVSRSSDTIGDPSALAIHEVDELLGSFAPFDRDPAKILSWTNNAYALETLAARAWVMNYWSKSILTKEVIPSKETIDGLIAEFNRRSLSAKPHGWDKGGDK